jgi:hypothetical protein
MNHEEWIAWSQKQGCDYEIDGQSTRTGFSGRDTQTIRFSNGASVQNDMFIEPPTDPWLLLSEQRAYYRLALDRETTQWR